MGWIDTFLLFLILIVQIVYFFSTKKDSNMSYSEFIDKITMIVELYNEMNMGKNTEKKESTSIIINEYLPRDLKKYASKNIGDNTLVLLIMKLIRMD